MVNVDAIAYHFSSRNRHKKWRFFLKALSPRPEDTTLDVGFSEREFSDTTNYIEKHYPYRHRLTALGIEEPKDICARYPEVCFHSYDGTTFPFDDSAFDLLWSNAVIEHVGDHDRQVAFLREIRRVARHFFITTPNLFFPVEVHTRTPLLHYLGKERFDRYLHAVGKRWAAGDYMHLLSRQRIERLCVDAGVTDYTLVPNRLFGFVLEFWLCTPRETATTQQDGALCPEAPTGTARSHVHAAGSTSPCISRRTGCFRKFGARAVRRRAGRAVSP